MSAFTINGVTFNPSSIRVKQDFAATEGEAWNGTPHLTVLGNRKRKFTITWLNVPWSTVAAIAVNAANLNTMFALHTDEGDTITVQNTTEDSFAWETGLIKSDGGQLYNITYNVRES